MLGTVSVLAEGILFAKISHGNQNEGEYNMSYVSIREVTPLRGKDMILEERMKQISKSWANTVQNRPYIK